MRSWLVRVVIVLCVGLALGAGAVGGYLAVLRGQPRPDEVAPGWRGRIEWQLWKLAHAEEGLRRAEARRGQTAPARIRLFVAAVTYGPWLACATFVALAALLWRRQRWALLGFVALTLVMIAGVWFFHAMVAGMEDPRFAARSPYVRATRLLSIALTVAGVGAAALAGVAWWRARPAAPEPGASAPA